MNPSRLTGHLASQPLAHDPRDSLLRESVYSSVCAVSAKLLPCCERRLGRQGLLEGLEDVKSALASACSSLLHCQFPPAWEDGLLVSASSGVRRNMEP